MNKNSSNQGGMNWGGRRGRVPSNIGERRHPTIIPQGEFFIFFILCDKASCHSFLLYKTG